MHRSLWTLTGFSHKYWLTITLNKEKVFIIVAAREHVQTIPLAFDSMGVRSMCCFLKGEKNVLVDPGASLGPKRFGLPPHKLELQQLMKKRELIQEYAQKADIVTVSHWHNDHYTPFINGLYGSVTPELAASVYARKPVLAKSFKKLNFMQKKRASAFQTHCTFQSADDKTYTFGETTLRFSAPVPHGTFKKIPVTMLSVEDKKKVVHASDTQGFSGLSFIKDEQPDILIMSGPPVPLLNSKEIQKAESNILAFLDCCDQLILDHHHVRNQEFRTALSSVWKSSKVKTAAEVAGQPTMLLEARRKELYSRM